MSIRQRVTPTSIVVSTLSALGFFAPAAARASDLVFPSTQFVLPETTAEVVRGDLDGDGKDDLFVGTQAAASFVLLADGQGGFAIQPAASLLGDALRARLGDLDNDGDLDVVASGLGSHQAMAALGNGLGSFGTAYGLAPAGSWLQFELGDLNGDGNLDLAGASRTSGKVGLWLGIGGGAMVAGGAPATLHSAAFEARLHDVDADSDLDLVLGGSFGVRWFGNDQQGALLPGLDLVVTPTTHVLEFLDLNGDAFDDLVVANASGTSLNVHLASPGGAFGPAASYAHGLGLGGPGDAVQGDLDGDGRADLAVLSSFGTSVSVLLSNGHGAFGPPANQAVETETFDQDVELLDADGDGDLDLAAADGRLTLLFNGGAGSFGKLVPAGEEPAGLTAVDFDHDGHLDLVVSNGVSQDLSVHRGLGDGTFQPLASPALSNSGGAIAAGDLTGDGWDDLAVALPAVNSIEVLIGNGAGGFAPLPPIATGVDPRSIAIDDVTGDGRSDIVVACAGSDEIRIYRSLGSGAFSPAIAIPAGDHPRDVVIADFTSDGVADIVAANLNSGSLTFLRSDGAGNFAVFQHNAGGHSPSSLAAGDMNEDGYIDLVATSAYQGSVAVFLTQPAAAFGPPVTYPADEWTAHVALADLDRDGHLDVVAARSLSPFEAMGNSVVVLRGDGTGSLAAPTLHAGGIDPTNLIVADFDEDGRPDAAVASYNGVAILENRLPDCGTFATFGSACAGTLVQAPALTPLGCAATGAAVTLRITEGPASANGLLLLGIGTTPVSLPFGCNLLVSIPLPIAFPLTLSPDGLLEIQAILPAEAAGVQVDLQAFLFDSSSPHGFGATNGVHLSVTNG